jgi:methionine synthase II (cobalamin-independent)
MPIDTTNLPAYHDAMQALFNLLNQAFNSAPNLDAEIAIDNVADAVSDVLTQLNQAGLAADTAQLEALQPSVEAVNAQLAAAQAQVNNWVKDAGNAAQIVGLMAKAVQLAGTVFAA